MICGWDFFRTSQRLLVKLGWGLEILTRSGQWFQLLLTFGPRYGGKKHMRRRELQSTQTKILLRAFSFFSSMGVCFIFPFSRPRGSFLRGLARIPTPATSNPTQSRVCVQYLCGEPQDLKWLLKRSFLEWSFFFCIKEICQVESNKKTPKLARLSTARLLLQSLFNALARLGSLRPRKQLPRGREPTNG